MYCCVPGCSSRYGKDKISFHQFPKNNKARLEKWIEAVGKMAEASSGAFVCGRHFVGGKAARNGEVDSPDWVPSLLLHGSAAYAPPRLSSDFRPSTVAAAAAPPVEEDPLDFEDEPNVRCLVRGCAMSRDDNVSSLHFFPVPVEEPIRARWFRTMGVVNAPSVRSRPPAAVCELHFELAKDLDNYDDFITLGLAGVLRPGVVPTRNVPGLGIDGDAAAAGSGHEVMDESMEKENSLLQELAPPMDTNGDDMMPEYPDHMQSSPVEEFVHVCRSCLCTDKTSLVSGFEDNLVDIFYQFTNVTIRKNDGISTEFCQDCRNRLLELHFFRDTCVTSTQILIHRYQKCHGVAPDCDQGDESMMGHSDFGNGSIASTERHGQSFAPDDPEDLLMPQKEEAYWDKSFQQKRRGRPPRKSDQESEQVWNDWAETIKQPKKLVKKRYNCKVCHKEYNSRVGLDTHQATHKDDNPEEFTVSCDKCPVMRRPGDRHSCHVNTMSCHVCLEKFRSWSYLKIHLAKVHKIKTKLRELLVRLKAESMLQGKRRSHPDPIGYSGHSSATVTSAHSPHIQLIQKPQKCGFCEAVFKNRNTLDSHLRTHSLEQLTECSECGESFDCYRALERHFDLHQDHNLDTKSGLVNKCHLCGKVLRRRQTLMLHRQYVHCDREVVKCESCPRLFPNGRHLAEHQCPAGGKRAAGASGVVGGINGDFLIVKPESILKGSPKFELNDGGDDYEDRRPPVPMQEDNDNADPLLGLGNEDIIELGSDDDEEEESSNQSSKSSFTCNVCGKIFEKEDVLDRHMKLHRMMSAANARK